MDRTELEERIRAALRHDAEGVTPAPDAWGRVERRLRRRRWGRAVAVAAGVAVVAGAAVAAPRLIDLATRQRVVVPGGPEPAPTALPPPVPSPAPPPDGPYFPGFWPATSYPEAREIQARVDRGEDAWRTDPIEVARRFVAEFMKAVAAPMSDATRSGSSATGWTAEVAFRPMIGEGRPLQPGARHVMRLYGLPGTERPAWFVSGVESEKIVVDRPREGDPVSSPMPVAGRGEAYEGNIVVEIRDDDGMTLHPRPGLFEGFVTAGQGELHPFSGELEFLPSKTRAGIVIFTGDTGAGPVPDWTIVRVMFASNLPTMAPPPARGSRPTPSPAPSG